MYKSNSLIIKFTHQQKDFQYNPKKYNPYFYYIQHKHTYIIYKLKYYNRQSMNFHSELKQTPKLRKNPQRLFQQQTSQNFKYNQQNPSRRSRLSYSPLKNPLESAINKVVNHIHKKQQFKKPLGNLMIVTPKSQVSSSRNIYSKSTKRFSPNCQPDHMEDKQILDRLNPETLQFLKKYFIGYSSNAIPVVTFIEFLMKQYSNLWLDSQAKAIMPQFMQKLSEKLGEQYIELNLLYTLTLQNGLIGLILNIFREIKQQHEQLQQIKSELHNKSSRSIVQSRNMQSNQIKNLKNIIQQFMQGLYKRMQNEIYNRLNNEMRRLMLKYKQTQGILKSINQRINENIDKICYVKKKSQLQKQYQLNFQKLNERIKQLQIEIQKQKYNSNLIKNQNQKLKEDNKKFNQTIDKFQNYFFIQQNKNYNQEEIPNPISQQKYRSNTIHIPNHNFTSPIQSPTNHQIIYNNNNNNYQNNHQNLQNIVTPTIQIIPHYNNYNNLYQLTQPVSQKPLSNISDMIANQQKRNNISNIAAQINDLKKGITTTLNDKQNNARSMTPTKNYIHKPLSSPNNLLKIKKN